MKYVGIDIGDKKCGIAISDSSNTFASPVCVVPTKDIVSFVVGRYKGADDFGIVLGQSKILPKTLNKASDETLNEIMDKIEKIKSIFTDNGYTTFYEPEWFSSFEANRRDKGNDAKAAAIILQRFLER